MQNTKKEPRCNEAQRVFLEPLTNMITIPDKRYLVLRTALSELGYSGFNKSLADITDRGANYISNIVTGHRQFNKQEMDMILAAIGVTPTAGNYLFYFPTLGIDRRQDTIDNISQGYFQDFLEKVMEVCR